MAGKEVHKEVEEEDLDLIELQMLSLVNFIVTNFLNELMITQNLTLYLSFFSYFFFSSSLVVEFSVGALGLAISIFFEMLITPCETGWPEVPEMA